MAAEPKGKVGRPPTRKKLLTLRLEPDIVDYYREKGGKGWLQGVNDTLKRAMNDEINPPKRRPRRLAAE